MIVHFRQLYAGFGAIAWGAGREASGSSVQPSAPSDTSRHHHVVHTIPVFMPNAMRSSRPAISSGSSSSSETPNPASNWLEAHFRYARQATGIPSTPPIVTSSTPPPETSTPPPDTSTPPPTSSEPPSSTPPSTPTESSTSSEETTSSSSSGSTFVAKTTFTSDGKTIETSKTLVQPKPSTVRSTFTSSTHVPTVITTTTNGIPTVIQTYYVSSLTGVKTMKSTPSPSLLTGSGGGSSGPSLGTKVGLGVGIPIAVAVLAALFYFLLAWMKKRRENKNRISADHMDDPHVGTGVGLGMSQGDAFLTREPTFPAIPPAQQPTWNSGLHGSAAPGPNSLGPGAQLVQDRYGPGRGPGYAAGGAVSPPLSDGNSNSAAYDTTAGKVELQADANVSEVDGSSASGERDGRAAELATGWENHGSLGGTTQYSGSGGGHSPPLNQYGTSPPNQYGVSPPDQHGPQGGYFAQGGNNGRQTGYRGF